MFLLPLLSCKDVSVLCSTLSRSFLVTELGKNEFILLYCLPRSATCTKHPPSLPVLPLLPKEVGHGDFGRMQFCSLEYCFESCSVDIPLFFFFFLVGGKLLCDVLLASAAQQCESAVSIHISPLSPASLPSAHPVCGGSGHHRAPDWARVL